MATDKLWESAIPNGVSAVNLGSDHTCDSRCVGLYVGGAGAVKVDMQNATGVSIAGVAAGSLLPGRFTKVYSTANGTSATNITEFFYRA